MKREKEITKLFGRKMRQIRLGKGFSQEGLADEAGLDRSYVGGIERGERNPSLKNIALIAAALKIEIKALFDFEI
jgi:transcriptional regulator with XRE-family HTH domain